MRLILYMSTDYFVLHCFANVGRAMKCVKIVPEMTYYLLSGTLNLPTRCQCFGCRCLSVYTVFDHLMPKSNISN